MLIAYDFECENCKQVIEQFVDSEEKNKSITCPICGEDMHRVFSSMNFKLNYDPKKDMVGWSFNNYNRSCYWDEIKKAKKEGKKDVVPATEVIKEQEKSKP